jgi:hypothetical protein
VLGADGSLSIKPVEQVGKGHRRHRVLGQPEAHR